MNEFTEELLKSKISSRSLILWKKKNGQKTYVVCSYYNENKEIGSRWDWGHYFDNLEDALKYWEKTEVTGNIELKEMIEDFNVKLEAAQDARVAILCYLEDTYGLDGYDAEKYSWYEDECDWCYGINTTKIEKAIKEKNR